MLYLCKHYTTSKKGSAMSTTASLLLELATLHERLAASLRADASALAHDEGPVDPMARALERHPQMGPRQQQIMQMVIDAADEGIDTGVISRTINYTQPNVHLTLGGLIRYGLVRKDGSARPHKYYADHHLFE